MKYSEALRRFGKCYRDRYTVEFPVIFELCDFEDKIVLEVGAGKEEYFPKEAKKLIKKYVATDISEDILKELKTQVDVETRVCRAENLPFADKSFDIVFSRWVIQHVEDLQKAIKEMCRTAKENVIIVLPSEEGEQTELMKMKYPDKYDYRKQRILNIKKQLSECTFKVKEEKRILNFIFPSIKEAVEIISAVDFENDLNESEKQKLKEFFSKRKTGEGVHFTQGASFISGYK